MCDIAGLIYRGRKEEMFPEKEVFAQGEKPDTLAGTLEGADIFIGLSAADLVTPEMLQRICDDPVIFALANPNPEIPYEVARSARPDAIVASGRVVKTSKGSPCSVWKVTIAPSDRPIQLACRVRTRSGQSMVS